MIFYEMALKNGFNTLSYHEKEWLFKKSKLEQVTIYLNQIFMEKLNNSHCARSDTYLINLC